MKVLVAGYSQEDTRRLSAELRAAGHQVLGAVGRHGARTFVKVVTPDFVVVPAAGAAIVREWLADFAAQLSWVVVPEGQEAAAALGRATLAPRAEVAVSFEPPASPRPATAPLARPAAGRVTDVEVGAAGFTYFDFEAADRSGDAAQAPFAAAEAAVEPHAEAHEATLWSEPEPARPPVNALPPTRPAAPRSTVGARAASPAAVVGARTPSAPVGGPDEPGARRVAFQPDGRGAAEPFALEPPPLPSRAEPTRRADRPAGPAALGSLGGEATAPQDADLVSKLAQTRFGDYHSILEIEPEASPYAVREQYARLSRLYSPRGWPRKLGPEDLEVLQEVAGGIRDAHLILSDPELRARYERALLGSAGATPTRRS